MRVDELRNVLKQEGVREDAFSLEGGTPDERYVLSRGASGTWSVYYSERGIRTSVKEFRTEEDACDHLLRTLLSDPTTR